MIEIGKNVYKHNSVLLYGSVRIDDFCSLWPYAVVRSEVHSVEIGENTNIQDHVMIHVGVDTATTIGKNCSITHHATIHGATIGNNTLIGIGAIVMDGAKVGNNSIVAANAVVSANSVFPDNSIIAGTPAKQIATKDCSGENLENAKWYLQAAARYLLGKDRL